MRRSVAAGSTPTSIPIANSNADFQHALPRASCPRLRLRSASVTTAPPPSATALSRRFVMDPRESSIDGRRSLTLDYSAENGLFWGTMRDELREVRPGLLLGLGSIGALGGALNSAVFCLEAAPVGVARTSTGG